MSKFLYSTDSNTPQGDGSKRLSERFGIPEHEVKKLLYGEQARPNPTLPPQGVPVMITPPKERSYWNPISVLGALLGVIGILSLVALMMVLMNHRRPPFGAEFGMNQPPPMMRNEIPQPAQPMPPTAMTDSCCKTDKTPATADAQPEPTPEEQIPKAKPQRKAVHKATPSKGFVTSNSMEAEERLAELKADGNAKAKISSRKKDGVLMYEVK